MDILEWSSNHFKFLVMLQNSARQIVEDMTLKNQEFAANPTAFAVDTEKATLSPRNYLHKLSMYFLTPFMTTSSYLILYC